MVVKQKFKLFNILRKKFGDSPIKHNIMCNDYKNRSSHNNIFCLIIRFMLYSRYFLHDLITATLSLRYYYRENWSWSRVGGEVFTSSRPTVTSASYLRGTRESDEIENK